VTARQHKRGGSRRGAEGERATGAPNTIYGLSSVLSHALEGGASYDTYIEDAEREGNQGLGRVFRQVRDEDSNRADRAQQLAERLRARGWFVGFWVSSSEVLIIVRRPGPATVRKLDLPTDYSVSAQALSDLYAWNPRMGSDRSSPSHAYPPRNSPRTAAKRSGRSMWGRCPQSGISSRKPCRRRETAIFPWE